MKEIFIWLIGSGLLFIGFLTTLIFGLVKKKRKIVFTSIAVFLICAGCGIWTAYLFVSKSYRHINNSFQPRTGEEIYTALFGKTNGQCVKVLNYQDQVVPKIDYAIWLNFTSCPNELSRILQQKKYQFEKQSTQGWNTQQPNANNMWFKPENLGDSVLVFEFKLGEYGNGQKIYSNLDSTEVFCVDILD